VACKKALAEAIRVLRPGGLLLGYDLLDTAPVRLLHFGEGHDTGLLWPGQFEAEFGRLHATTIRVRPGCRQTGCQVRLQQSRINPGPTAVS